MFVRNVINTVIITDDCDNMIFVATSRYAKIRRHAK